MSETNNQNLEDDEIYATLVEINQEPTELYKILKFENLVAGGGEAKQLIAEGYVLLNGEIETQKRKKVYAGDLVGFNGEYYHIALKGESGDYEIVDEIPSTYDTEAHAKASQSEKQPNQQKQHPKQPNHANTKNTKSTKTTESARSAKSSVKKPKARKSIQF